jgi:hypothetical protein
MIGTLYRYPHPCDLTRFIYVGQGPKRDVEHRSGRSVFGRNFKKLFPGVELPQPVREQIEVSDHIQLNEEETIWMFRFHTWRGYPGGMNLLIPGSQDYKRIGKIRGLLTASIPGHTARAGRIGGSIAGPSNGRKLLERKRGLFGRTKEKIIEDARKGGLVGGLTAGKIARDSGQLAALRTPEHQREAGRKSAARLGGMPKNGLHVRWHVKRNKPNLKCNFCREEIGAIK